jgi:hypothetical protein
MFFAHNPPPGVGLLASIGDLSDPERLRSGQPVTAPCKRHGLGYDFGVRPTATPPEEEEVVTKGLSCFGLVPPAMGVKLLCPALKPRQRFGRGEARRRAKSADHPSCRNQPQSLLAELVCADTAANSLASHGSSAIRPDRRGLWPLPFRGGQFANRPSETLQPLVLSVALKIVFLLFTRTGPRSFQQGVATANADSSDVQQVTNSPTFDHQADWGLHPLIP